MANGFVRVTLIGNLGKDPEVRFVASGTAVCNMRVACTERVKHGDEWTDATEWINIVCFGKTAESAGQYLAKGRQVYVEGRLQTREWADKDGNKRFTTEVLANRVLFLGGGQGHGSDSKARPANPPVSAGMTRDDLPPLNDDLAPF